MVQYPYMEVKNRFLNDNQCRFLLSNMDLPLIILPGVEIVAYEKENVLLAIGMIIDETANDKSKKEALTYMVDWQKRLINWQGSYKTKIRRDDVVRTAYEKHRNEGIKAKAVAKTLNDVLCLMLLFYCEFVRKLRFQEYKFKTLGDYFDWFNKHMNDPVEIDYQGETKTCPMGQARAYQSNIYDILMDFLNDPQKSARIISNAIQKILAYQVPFHRNFPISDRHIYLTCDRYEGSIEQRSKDLQILTSQFEIPEIFDNWDFHAKIQWGRNKGKLVQNIRDKEFIFEAFTNPFGISD